MNEKAASVQQKALQERKRGQHDKAIKRLEQGIASFPDELDLYLDAIDACLEGGEVARATQFLKTTQDRFTRDRERIALFVREKLLAVHDPALARFVVENAIKLRDLPGALDHLDHIPDHTVRDLLARTRTKKQSLKSATHGGYSLRGELLTNELMTVLLSARIGNLKDAVAGLVQILDGKPVEQAILMPFIENLEGRHSKSGRVRFARAVAQCGSGAELESINTFVEAARLEPPVAALCIDRLKILLETSKARTRVERALAEVYLLKGDLDDAAQVLRAYLATEKDAGRDVMLLVRPYADPNNGVNACTWLALDASLTIDKSNVALEILRPMHQRGNCSEALLEWFEGKTRDAFLTSEMMTFHATLALDLKKYERAAEILRGVCAANPQEVQAVLSIVDRHRSAHESLDALYREYAAREAETSGEGAADLDNDGFQNFDNREFGMGTAPQPATAPKPATENKPLDFAARMRGNVQKKAFVETRELSFDDDNAAPEPAPAADAAAVAPAPAAADMDGFELSDGPSMGQRPRLAPQHKADKTGVSEAHVSNVAHKLYEAGAAAFFHVDSDETKEPVSEPAPVVQATPAAEPDAEVEAPASQGPLASDPEPAPAPEPEIPATFEGHMELFRAGKLSGAAIVALMQTASEGGRCDELGELLKFEPAGDEEVFARRFFEADHMLMSNRPLPALRVLTSLDTPGLDDEQKRRVWFKLATCQRAVHDFAGAQETLDRLVEAFPSQEEYARLARTNLEQKLAENSGQTMVLEKTSSLD